MRALSRVSGLLWLFGLLLCSAGCEETEDVGGRATRSAQPAQAVIPPRLVILPDLNGTLEPCGCTTRSQGGVDRFAGVLSQLRRQTPSLFVLASGQVLPDEVDTSAEGKRQGAFKREVLQAVVQRLAIDLVAPTPEEAKREPLTITKLAASRTLLLERGDLPSVLAATPSRAVHTLGPAVLGVMHGAKQTEMAELKRQGATHILALVHGDEPLARAAAERGADLVVLTGTGRNEPKVEQVGKSLVMSGGRQADGFWFVEGGPSWIVEYRHLTVDDAPDPSVRRLLDQSFARLREGARSSVEPRAEADERGRRYVGSDTCAACHTQAYFWWRESAHGKAFESLVGRARELDHDCVGCHVTGFGRATGASLSNLEHLTGVGCESCHGAGSAHADDPTAEAARPAPHVGEAVCMACHDAEHSEGFRFESARSQLSGPGHPVASGGRELGLLAQPRQPEQRERKHDQSHPRPVPP